MDPVVDLPHVSSGTDRDMPDPAASTPVAPEQFVLAVASLTTLSACGGGSGGGSSATPSPIAPEPSPEPSPPTTTQAARFLQQAAFSSSEADAANVQALGYAAWLEREFAKPISQSNWEWLYAHGYADLSFINSSAGASNVIWQRLITADDVLRQRVTLALSEIFVVGFQGVTSIPYRPFVMAAWWDLLCEHAFGNYRTLLEAVTLSAAMGRYLNTSGNQKEDPARGRQPDENYAREVLQLFSIGLYELNPDGTTKLGDNGQPIETYTQDTVTQLARVFTGWSIPAPKPVTDPSFARLPMTLNAAQHSTLEARFLGATVPAGTDGRTALGIALDTIFKHPNVGPFIGRQMIQRLVTSNPSPAYVARVAAAFDDNGQGIRGDLRALVRAVLLDEEARSDAWSANPGFGKLREPMLRFLQWARTFRASSTDGAWGISDLSDPGSRLGQQPLNSPSVFNFFRPGYVPPNTGIAAQGLVAPEFQLVHETSVAGYMNFMQTVVASGTGKVVADYSPELAIADDAQALVQRMNLLLCAGAMSTATQSTLRDALATISTSTETGRKNRVHAAVFMTLCCPDYLIQK
ncbi:MAG: DUF1800 domain-containing protein [Pseudomonadota bacterium]